MWWKAIPQSARSLSLVFIFLFSPVARSDSQKRSALKVDKSKLLLFWCVSSWSSRFAVVYKHLHYFRVRVLFSKVSVKELPSILTASIGCVCLHPWAARKKKFHPSVQRDRSRRGGKTIQRWQLSGFPDRLFTEVFASRVLRENPPGLFTSKNQPKQINRITTQIFIKF